MPTLPTDIPEDLVYATRGEEKTIFANKINTFNKRMVLEVVPAMNDVAQNVYDNAVEAYNSSQTATTKAGEASTSASQALTYRDETEGLRNETANIVASIPDGTINDTITTLTDTWSSSKIASEISSAGAVDSVNGKTGVVILTKTDVGLGNVDNTADADKLINASNLNTGTVPSPRLPNATSTEAGALKARLNGTEAFFTFNGVDA